MGKVKKDKVSKPIVDPKSKPHSPKKKKNSERKSTEDWNRKYGLIFPQSIKSMAESVGIGVISDDVASSLSEDVSYRLRSIIQLCAKYLKHTRHRRLRCEDVNEVLEMCDIPAVVGHAAHNAPTSFTPVREANVIILEDSEIDLYAYSLAEVMVTRKPSLTVAGKWLSAEEQRSKLKLDDVKGDTTNGIGVRSVQPVNNVVTSHLKAEGDAKSAENHKNPEHMDNEPKIATNLIKYYGITCNTILGHSDLKLVYRDLSRNEKILPIVPYLLNFITITLNKLGSERQILRLLQTVESLTKNTKVDFRPYHPVIRVANALLKIIKTVAVEKKRDVGLQSLVAHDRSGQKVQFSYSNNIRIRAAQVLAKVAKRWCCSEEQRSLLVQEMSKLLLDLRLPSGVHVGAVALLKEIGPPALRAVFWNYLSTFLQYVEAMRQARSPLELAILEAAQILYRNPHGLHVVDCPPPDTLDRVLYEYFGDAICPSRLQLLENPRFLQRHVSTPTTSKQLKPMDSILRGTWRLPKCRNSMYNAEAKRPTIHTAFKLPKFTKKRNPRIIFKFAGANPVPEMSLRRRRLDSRYSQFIAGKVSEGHVVLVGKFWRRPKRPQTTSPLQSASIFSII